MTINNSGTQYPPLANHIGYQQFFKIMVWEYLIMFAMTVFFVKIALLSNASAIWVVAMQYIVSIIVNSFSLYAMRQVLSENVYTFPYGAGKLENFSAFLCGFFYVPFAVYIIYDAIIRLNDAPEVGYLLSQIPVIVSLVSMTVFYQLVKNLTRRLHNPSPLLLAYLLDFRIALMSDIGVLISLTLGWALVKFDLTAIGNRIDPVVSLLIAIYMLWIGSTQVWHNFRALMDLPLSEQEQFAITKVLTRHFADYESIGTLYTRSSGKRCFVEIELGFDPEQTMQHVQELSLKMTLDLTAELPDLTFRIIPIDSEVLDKSMDDT